MPRGPKGEKRPGDVIGNAELRIYRREPEAQSVLVWSLCDSHADFR